MRKLFIIIAALTFALTSNAQTKDDYFVGKDFISYDGRLVKEADPASFEVLGHGYAKDSRHVYQNGEILPYVNPNSFSLDGKGATNETAGAKLATNKEKPAKQEADKKNGSTILDQLLWTSDTGENRYEVTDKGVAYDGKTISKADAKSFVVLGEGYAADRRHAYYNGKVLSDAWGKGQFQYKGNGYATDGVRWYCNGKPVDRD